ncbi:hypothetical protein QBC42DRAFT_259708 [Cladorrhinum samala]|uniref:AIG1-type G domain-containing protein n=1 Tax=Cladorrhinum samala TaxID=585594 RepID=A0AAV9HZC5_9PEZI|nr:hypothetical protein QBC42DRAFT_259708 [Cladorrhinum samala]
MSSEGIILVLGVTGAGKSYFINQLKRRGSVSVAEERVEEGHTLNSETEVCQAVRIVLDDDDDDPRSITVVDTPGFDDTKRPDGEVFAEISDYLAAQHASGIPLKGVLYLHKITENRMTGSSGTYLKILQQLIGEEALGNTIMVTTMWYMLREEFQGEGLNRQQQLIDEFWRPLIDKGAWVARFDGTPASAFQIVSQLAGRESVVLEHQRELVDEERDLGATGAGRSLLQQLESTKVEYSLKLANLEKELERETARGNRTAALEKERQVAEISTMLKRLDKSLSKLNTRPGPRIKQQVSRLMTGENATRAVSVLAAILNVTLFVVRVVVGA